MEISKEEIAEVIRRVLTYYKRKKVLENTKRTLYLIPSCPVGLDEILMEYDLYGISDDMDFAVSEEIMTSAVKEKQVFFKENKIQMQHIFRRIPGYKRLEIHCPSFDFLRAVKDAREEDLFVRITLYFLMMHKPVLIRHPYRPENLPSGRFSKAAAELQRDLWDMGITFTDLKVNLCDAVSKDPGIEDGLITEQIVDSLYKNGAREFFAMEGTVITPLALERAKELGVRIIQE